MRALCTNGKILEILTQSSSAALEKLHSNVEGLFSTTGR